MAAKKQKQKHRPAPAPAGAPSKLARVREHASAGQLRDAQQLLDGVLRAAPRDADAQLAQLQLALQLGNATAAAHAFATWSQLAPGHPAADRLALRQLALAGQHRRVRTLLAEQPALLAEEPWAAAYLAPPAVPDEAARTAWSHLLDDVVARHAPKPWAALYAKLAPAERPWAWTVALGKAAAAVYQQERPPTELVAWLASSAEALPAAHRQRFLPAQTSLEAFVAALEQRWDEANALLARIEAPGEVLAHQRLLLALHQEGRSTPIGRWVAFLAPLLERLRHEPAPLARELAVEALDRLDEQTRAQERVPREALPLFRQAATLFPDDAKVQSLAANLLFDAGALPSELLPLIERWSRLEPTATEPTELELQVRERHQGLVVALEHVLPRVGSPSLPLADPCFLGVLACFAQLVREGATRGGSPRQAVAVWSRLLERVPDAEARTGLALIALTEARSHEFLNRPEAIVEVAELCARFAQDPGEGRLKGSDAGEDLKQGLMELVSGFLALAPGMKRADAAAGAERLARALERFVPSTKRLSKPLGQLRQLAQGGKGERP